MLHHILVGLQRLGIILLRVIDECIEVVHIGQLIAVERLLATGGNHFVQNLGRSFQVLGFSGRLRLRQFLVNLITQRRSAASFPLFFLLFFLRDRRRQWLESKITLQLRHRHLNNKYRHRQQCSASPYPEFKQFHNALTAYCSNV